MSDKPRHYNLDFKNSSAEAPKILSGEELAALYQKLCQNYPSALNRLL